MQMFCCAFLALVFLLFDSKVKDTWLKGIHLRVFRFKIRLKLVLTICYSVLCTKLICICAHIWFKCDRSKNDLSQSIEIDNINQFFQTGYRLAIDRQVSTFNFNRKIMKVEVKFATQGKLDVSISNALKSNLILMAISFSTNE